MDSADFFTDLRSLYNQGKLNGYQLVNGLLKPHDEGDSPEAPCPLSNRINGNSAERYVQLFKEYLLYHNCGPYSTSNEIRTIDSSNLTDAVGELALKVLSNSVIERCVLEIYFYIPVAWRSEIAGELPLLFEGVVDNNCLKKIKESFVAMEPKQCAEAVKETALFLSTVDDGPARADCARILLPMLGNFTLYWKKTYFLAVLHLFPPQDRGPEAVERVCSLFQRLYSQEAGDVVLQVMKKTEGKSLNFSRAVLFQILEIFTQGVNSRKNFLRLFEILEKVESKNEIALILQFLQIIDDRPLSLELIADFVLLAQKSSSFLQRIDNPTIKIHLIKFMLSFPKVEFNKSCIRALLSLFETINDARMVSKLIDVLTLVSPAEINPQIIFEIKCFLNKTFLSSTQWITLRVWLQIPQKDRKNMLNKAGQAVSKVRSQKRGDFICKIFACILPEERSVKLVHELTKMINDLKETELGSDITEAVELTAVRKLYSVEKFKELFALFQTSYTSDLRKKTLETMRSIRDELRDFEWLKQVYSMFQEAGNPKNNYFGNLPLSSYSDSCELEKMNKPDFGRTSAVPKNSLMQIMDKLPKKDKIPYVFSKIVCYAQKVEDLSVLESAFEALSRLPEPRYTNRNIENFLNLLKNIHQFDSRQVLLDIFDGIPSSWKTEFLTESSAFLKDCEEIEKVSLLWIFSFLPFNMWQPLLNYSSEFSNKIGPENQIKNYLSVNPTKVPYVHKYLIAKLALTHEAELRSMLAEEILEHFEMLFLKGGSLLYKKAVESLLPVEDSSDT